MKPSSHLTTFSALIAGAFGDLSGYTYNSYNSPGAYDYSNYSSYYSPDSTDVSLGRKRRVLTTDNPLNIEVTFDLTMPLTDFNSKIEISVPFSFDLPSTKKRAFTGRSLSTSDLGVDSVRSSLYKQLEKYAGTFSGADGQACLLRAMCEVGSTPFHADGIFGDVVNFLLSANYAAEESDERFQSYQTAQSHGQSSGDCSRYHTECPMSFFNLISDNDL